MIHLEPYYKLEGRENLAWNKEAHIAFIQNFADGFVEKCASCVRESNEDKLKETNDINGETSTSLLKFQEWDPIHDIVSEKVNEAVDSIAIDRELDMEDEDTLVEKKKEELKKWFANNYQHELNQRGGPGLGSGAPMNANSGEGAADGNLAFTNLINMASQFDARK